MESASIKHQNGISSGSTASSTMTRSNMFPPESINSQKYSYFTHTNPCLANRQILVTE